MCLHAPRWTEIAHDGTVRAKHTPYASLLRANLILVPSAGYDDVATSSLCERPLHLSNTFVLITGCSGGGKSTLLCELSARGYATISEPGKRIVAEETTGTGRALPWVDLKAFATRAVAMAQSDLAPADKMDGLVFFDRGLVDAAVALQFTGGEAYLKTLGETLHYSRTVFLAPPWPEIFAQDKDRQHDFKSASEEFYRLEAALLNLGYDICTLPKLSVTDRANFVLYKLRNKSS